MLTHPKGFWQRGMWHLIHRICPNFKAQLCESRIPSPPPNTPEPLLARWKVLYENCEMCESIQLHAGTGQLCWDRAKGFCIIKSRQGNSSFVLQQVAFQKDGSFAPSKNATIFHSSNATANHSRPEQQKRMALTPPDLLWSAVAIFLSPEKPKAVDYT